MHRRASSRAAELSGGALLGRSYDGGTDRVERSLGSPVTHQYGLATIPSRPRGPSSWPSQTLVLTLQLEGDGLIFFLVERSKHTSKVIEQWEIRVDRCYVCGKTSAVFRLAHALGQDNLGDSGADFACLDYAQRNLFNLEQRGIQVYAERQLCGLLRDLERGEPPHEYANHIWRCAELECIDGSRASAAVLLARMSQDRDPLARRWR